ncbi:MAG TPA: PadR family transcriptional regulator [Candidatus Binatia bacterium]|nr:PadR family transcriptional regulator [Candidatus Binatia bacterium]
MVVATAILAILRDGPTHGYALRSELRERLGLVWPVNQGQVYSTLARLARDGLVATFPPSGSGGRRPSGTRYALTRAGERRLERALRAPVGLAPARGDADQKIAIAFARGDRALLRAVLEREHAACLALLETCRGHARTVARGASGASLAHASAIALLAADAECLAVAARDLAAEHAS